MKFEGILSVILAEQIDAAWFPETQHSTCLLERRTRINALVSKLVSARLLIANVARLFVPLWSWAGQGKLNHL
jgi:hypothetical protein